MELSQISGLIGGIGLFMLGMHLMTEGLKLAAGHGLRTMLRYATAGSFRAIVSGGLITSLVQSSSAITVAVIGFVNAGLMELKQAVVVVYGSNIGTTMTGWMVALAGSDVNIKAMALPAVGVGMLLHFIRGRGRGRGGGYALAGFGIFFLGIDILHQSFSSLEHILAPYTTTMSGGSGLVLLVSTGILLTAAMQSSSAAIALALTAAAGGLLSLSQGAALVIGANIGTTSTAVLASINATPNARRVAAAHVIFNLLTGVAALLLFPFFVPLLELIASGATKNVSFLALFHTTFNILGVCLMLPLTPFMVRRLETFFIRDELDEARPRFLDRTLAGTPSLAMNALVKELERMGAKARRITLAALSREAPVDRRMVTDRDDLVRLERAVVSFCTLLQRSHLPPEMDEALPNVLRVTAYYTEIGGRAMELIDQQMKLRPLKDHAVNEQVATFKKEVVAFLEAADCFTEGYSVATTADRAAGIDEEYHQLKAALLRNATRGEFPASVLVAMLEYLSSIRRIFQQAEKGARYMWQVRSVIENGAVSP